MGIKYLWDSNTVIYYLQQQFPLKAEKFIDDLLIESQPCISAITEIELLCWKAATPDDEVILHNFLKEAFIIELEQPIKFRTAELRKINSIKLPDAIIAAAALIYDFTLITRNVGDFKKIKDLKMIDVWKLD